MSKDIDTRLAALQLVKEWTLALVVLQTAAMGVVGGLLDKHPLTGWHLLLAIALFAALLGAIYLGAVCVAGTIPAIAQKLASTPGKDIYSMRGGLKGSGRWNLGRFCLWQSHLFILSLILFALFVVTIDLP